MAIAQPLKPRMGQRLSAGVYRNPTTGSTFNSTNGAIKIPKAKPAANAGVIATTSTPAASTPGTGGVVTASVNNAAGQAVPAVNPATLEANRKQLINEIQRRGGRQNAAGFNKKLMETDAQIRIQRKAGQTSTAETTPPSAEDTTVPPVAETTPPAGTDNLETLFPSTRMFEPQNYEGSPLYQFQLQEGQKQVARSLAKRGLTNSGAGIEQELNVPLRAAAQDTDRMTRVASENADRLYNMQNNESLRRERAGNDAWSRSFDATKLMLDQSPWNDAVAGLNNSADITSKAGQDKANFLKDFYARVFPSGGSGGRGGATATPLPLPNGPDYSAITPSQIAGDYSSNNGWMNIITKGLSNFFPK